HHRHLPLYCIFCYDTSSTQICTLSLHDALPISLYAFGSAVDVILYFCQVVVFVVEDHSKGRGYVFISFEQQESIVIMLLGIDQINGFIIIVIIVVLVMV